MSVHLAVADANDDQVQDILAERTGFVTDGSGVYSAGDVVFHVVPESYEWSYARRPDNCGNELVVGAIVRDPEECDDYVVAGCLEEGSCFTCIINEEEWRKYRNTRRSIRRLCRA
jgi:hypothetical protein